MGWKYVVNYEIGLKIDEPKVLWVYGPIPAGINDIIVFCESLKSKIPVGKRVFKECVLACQESFNKHLKIFCCLTMKFRHGVDNYKVAFEAVCVIVT